MHKVHGSIDIIHTILQFCLCQVKSQWNLKEFKFEVTLEKTFKLRYVFGTAMCIETHCHEDKFWNLWHMPQATGKCVACKYM